MTPGIRILVTGSRNWQNSEIVWGAIEHAIGDASEVVIVHGACPTGADQFAAEWCETAAQISSKYGSGSFTEERHPADWDKHGKAAGPRRNQQMVDLGADVCLAFPLADSRGTKHCMGAASAAGIPVRIYEPAADRKAAESA